MMGLEKWVLILAMLTVKLILMVLAMTLKNLMKNAAKVTVHVLIGIKAPKWMRIGGELRYTKMNFDILWSEKFVG
jgi:hypothetical protein